jgi:hypothetical protein
MTKKLKTELTRDEVTILLEVYNSIDSILEEATEMMDIRLSHLSDLRDKSWALRHMFNFRARADENGNPEHWKANVLPDDPNAWYHYTEETE